MRNSFLDLKVLIIFCISFASKDMHAQLGFCQGNSGDPIFTETFGTGLQDSPLPAGTTTYTYANGQAPDDGLYTVSSNSNYFDWFDANDHTQGDTNGRMLIVNSSFSAGEFYRTTINGLCENTTYEFSSWLLNLAPLNGFCGAGAIPVNVRFEIWDSTDTNLLTSGNTGNITGTITPTWNQYALVFLTIPAQTAVILKMINNSSGGCGNDLAIDDIVFKSCGDYISVSDGMGNASITVCSSQTPYSTTLTATPDFSVFSSHFYQWQESTDGITWTDIVGETNMNIALTGITTTTFYRSKVAESMVNVNNSSCNTISDMFQVNIDSAPAMPTTECWEVATFNNTTCSWSVTGTQPTSPTGLECWETAMFNNTTCIWEVTGTQPTQPLLECWQTTTFNTTTCVWEISGSQPVQPTIECWEVATFNNTACSWDIAGSLAAAPTGLECWQTAAFNDISCTWDITGTQPTQPNIACWEIATFNDLSCLWEVTGTQPETPTGLECWETAVFDNISCAWNVTGTQPNQPTTACWENVTFNTTTCTWDTTGTQPPQPTLECWETTIFNDTTCSWDVSGAQPNQPTLDCWQTATFNDTTCSWDITGTQPVDFIEEFLMFCEGEDIIMQADSDLVNPSYQWNTGEMTEFKTVDVAGTYVVVISDGCSTIEKTFYVEQIPNPIIESVVSDGSSIIINISNSGDFEYSLDGISFQTSPVFSSVDGGLYTIYVKGPDCDGVEVDHFHFYIPKFITPNDDGDNDFFVLRGIEYFTSSEVSIYNRYGKLLYQTKNAPPFWDGTFNNQPLPTNDYWYVIVIEGKRLTGHFTLKR